MSERVKLSSCLDRAPAWPGFPLGGSFRQHFCDDICTALLKATGDLWCINVSTSGRGSLLMDRSYGPSQCGSVLGTVKSSQEENLLTA